MSKNNLTVQTTDVKTMLKNNFRNYLMFIMLILIMVIFAVLSQNTNLMPRNFHNLFIQNGYVLILAVGMVQIIVTQNIELSVGSTCAFIGALSAMLYNTGIGMTLTVILSILMGIVIGAYQGAWVAYAKLPSFIVTLSGMMLFRGLTYIVTKVTPITPMDNGYQLFSTGVLDEILNVNKAGKYFPLPFVFAIIVLTLFFISEFLGRKKKIAQGFEVTHLGFFIGKLVLVSIGVLALAERFAAYRGLPVFIITLGIVVFGFHFILTNTVLGRYIYAVGGNPRSAKLSGINSEFVIFVVFLIMGGLTGLAAVIFTGYMNTALPQAGDLFELDTIAACYVGGVSAGGGIGSVIGVIVGALVMGAINNGMSIMMWSVHAQKIVKALILVLAVFLDVYNRRKAGLG